MNRAEQKQNGNRTEGNRTKIKTETKQSQKKQRPIQNGTEYRTERSTEQNGI